MRLLLTVYTTHPYCRIDSLYEPMPQTNLTREEIGDVAAYILTLKGD